MTVIITSVPTFDCSWDSQVSKLITFRKQNFETRYGVIVWYTYLFTKYPQGELTISSDMENLMESLYMDHVPESWTKLAYPSLLGLLGWFADLCQRLSELENWAGDFNVRILLTYLIFSAQIFCYISLY